jgi:hypothetical protein
MNFPLSSPDEAVFGTKSCIFKSILEADKNFVLWQRDLNIFLESWASEIKWNKIHPLEAELSLDDLDTFEEDLIKELRIWRTRDTDMNNWVANDMRLIIENFMFSTNASEVFVKIEPVSDDMCRLFHVDKNLLRLLCTYVGQGTLWLPSAKADKKFLGNGENKDIVLDPLSIFQAQKLDVLILKGDSWPNNLVGGAIHRSPKLESRERRLLLKVDFVS